AEAMQSTEAHVERAVARRLEQQQRRPRAGKMAQDKLAVSIRTLECAGVAIDAQNRPGNVATRLLQDQPPGFLTFRTGDALQVPLSGHGRRIDLRLRLHSDGARGVDRIVVLENRPVFAFELAVLYRCGQLRQVAVEIEDERTVL